MLEWKNTGKNRAHVDKFCSLAGSIISDDIKGKSMNKKLIKDGNPKKNPIYPFLKFQRFGRLAPAECLWLEKLNTEDQIWPPVSPCNGQLSRFELGMAFRIKLE